MEALEVVTTWWRAAGFSSVEKSVIRLLLLTSALYGVVWALEKMAGTRTDHYRHRGFWQDLAFWIYYRGGIHDTLFLTFIVLMLDPLLADYALNVLSTQPFFVQALIYIVLGDFIAYWIHRAEHRFAFMWAFHRTHHSQSELTFATAARFHPIEMVYHTLLAYIPLRLLGVPAMTWLPLFLALQLFTALQHTQVPWRLGPLYRVFATPSFHAFHHSADARHFDHHFANIFSLWDHLFGTALPRGSSRPTHFGLHGCRNQSLVKILAAPFQILWTAGTKKSMSVTKITEEHKAPPL